MDQLELFFSYSEISEITAEYEKVDSISDMLECLEGATREIRRKGLCGMYKKLFEFSQEINQEVESSIVDFSKCLIDQGGLSLLIHHLSFLTSRICTERDLVLEQELRMLLGIIYTSLVVLPLEFIQSEVSQHSGVIEESLLVIVKLSTEACFVPIKKVCMVLYRYLEIILDSPCKHDRELGPRARASQSAVEGFYQRMIGSGNLLSQVTVGLLRSLLACCPGATNSGIDLKQEYHSVILLTDKTDGVTQTHNLANFSDEARHRFITGLYISKLLLLLMKKFRLNHYMQAEYLSQLINDANGILVLLKFLNLESIDLCKLPIFPYMGEISRDLLIEECLSQMMILCYKVTKGHPDRIQANLIQFKSSLIFKKLLSKFPNTSLEIPCLKMLRIQIKYLTKKWKNYPSNMKVISEIYQKLKPCKEDWISDVPIEKPNSEEIRQKNYEFNYENYWRASENIPPDSPKIPQDFSEMYEEWLEENVWGYSYMY